MARRTPSVASLRLTRAELAGLDALARSRGFGSRAALLRAAIVEAATRRGAPAPQGYTAGERAAAAALPVEARTRYLAARRARRLEAARQGRPEDALSTIAQAVGLPGGAEPEELLAAVDALARKDAGAILDVLLAAVAALKPSRRQAH